MRMNQRPCDELSAGFGPLVLRVHDKVCGFWRLEMVNIPKSDMYRDENGLYRFIEPKDRGRQKQYCYNEATCTWTAETAKCFKKGMCLLVNIEQSDCPTRKPRRSAWMNQPLSQLVKHRREIVPKRPVLTEKSRRMKSLLNESLMITRIVDTAYGINPWQRPIRRSVKYFSSPTDRQSGNLVWSPNFVRFSPSHNCAPG